MIVCRPSQPSDKVLDAVSKWQESEKSRLYVFIVGQRPGDMWLDRILVDRIYRERKQFADIKALDLLLDCSGGDIEAAYQLVIFFRNRCEKFRVFIPDWAKSAATLLTLGGDEVWMSDCAEIGPLDAQIQDPKDTEKFISALEEFRAVDYLRTHSFETMNEFEKMMSRTTQFNAKDRLQLAIQYTTQVMAPLYSNVDPLHFGSSYRAVQMSTEYGERVMSRYAYSDLSQRKITEVLKKLAWDYPSHSFDVDFIEAKELGLKVHLLEGEMNDRAHVILDGMPECVGFIDEKILKPKSEVERGKAGANEEKPVAVAAAPAAPLQADGTATPEGQGLNPNPGRSS